ncbi:DUF6146 family protein [Lutibacter citreus]|uniref:DUF6146 family protein n=1 Tax=Lutibacter citreus TaxID=2138210 RepID=UPI000DBE67BA|nr:DUF6146 family protein [Lutibacter citreus]
MKKIISFIVILSFIISCGSTTKTAPSEKQLPEGAVRIANDKLEYEIIIIDPGFQTYLISIAKPKNFYSQNYYEIRNNFYVTEWNIRHKNPLKFNSNIYENEINYDVHTDYGLEVNYKLYNYFKFVEYKYKQVF